MIAAAELALNAVYAHQAAEWEAKVEMLSEKLSRANAAASAAAADRDADAAEARARADAAAQAEDSATARTDGILAAVIAEAQGKATADAAALESAKAKIKAQAEEKKIGYVLAPPKAKGFVNAGAAAGLEQWSIVVGGAGAGASDDADDPPECTLRKVAKGKQGLFNEGDCYLVLSTVAAERRGEFDFTIFLWIGPESELIERKRSAALAFELEQALTGRSKYVRVVGGRESKAWKALWRPGQYMIMAGGSETAFDPDDPLDWDPVLLHVWAPVHAGSTKKTTVTKISREASCMNYGAHVPTSSRQRRPCLPLRSYAPQLCRTPAVHLSDSLATVRSTVTLPSSPLHSTRRSSSRAVAFPGSPCRGFSVPFLSCPCRWLFRSQQRNHAVPVERPRRLWVREKCLR
jgi:hypothetical protein